MIVWGLDYLAFLVVVFVLGYFAIVFEYYLKVNKTAVALFVAVILWGIYFVYGPDALKHDLQELSSHLADISQIIFFLMAAMTLVEIIDSHKGFKIVTDLIQTSSKRKMLWFVAFTSFFLSAVLDNLTTTILMVSLLRKLIPDKEDRFLPACMVIIAANSGGAWTPIGDVTTTMLWISDRVTSLAIMKTLFLPSLVSMIVPLLIFNYGMKGKYKKPKV
ncbi:MAG: sodium:proton antiporter NhaD, partial [Chlamydiae bacterium]|nr:sodium:proton antiporter NhaD [Chlamydiota bacterium]